MRRSMILVGLAALFLFTAVVIAQDEPTPPPPSPEAILDEIHIVATAVAENTSLAESSAASAEEATELAFNLLGIFEAISVAITVVAAAAGVFGVGRLISAESSLTQAREEVEKEILAIREQFETDLEHRRNEFDSLSESLMQIVEKQQQESANATLATALLSFGERQYRAADYVGAVNTYRRALELDNNNPVTFYRLGYVYTSQGELEAAEEHLKKSLSIDDNFAPAMVALGFVYRKMGEKLEQGIEREQRFNLGEKLMLEGLKISPKLVDEDGESWWGALGGLYRRRGQVDQATYAYEQATMVTPHSSYPFSNLATLYGRENKVEDMLRMFKRVERLAFAEVQAEVDNYWGYFDLLTAQLANGYIEKAEDVLPSVLETVPNDAAYAFDVLKDTLRRVAGVLHDYPHADDILKFIDRIDDYLLKRNQDPTRIIINIRPEDAEAVNVDGNTQAAPPNTDDEES